MFITPDLLNILYFSWAYKPTNRSGDHHRGTVKRQVKDPDTGEETSGWRGWTIEIGVVNDPRKVDAKKNLGMNHQTIYIYKYIYI